jgi:hypothetical protein
MAAESEHNPLVAARRAASTTSWLGAPVHSSIRPRVGQLPMAPADDPRLKYVGRDVRPCCSHGALRPPPTDEAAKSSLLRQYRLSIWRVALLSPVRMQLDHWPHHRQTHQQQQRAVSHSIRAASSCQAAVLLVSRQPPERFLCSDSIPRGSQSEARGAPAVRPASSPPPIESGKGARVRL